MISLFVTSRIVRQCVDRFSIHGLQNRIFHGSCIIVPDPCRKSPKSDRPLYDYDFKRYKATGRKTYPRRVLDFAYTGDHYPGPAPLDLSLPRIGYEDVVDRIQDPTLKRMCTLEFADENERREYRLKKIQDMIRAHPLDDNTPEEKLTKMTLKMRAQMKHALKVKKDKQAIHHVRCRYNRRRKMIVDLRQTDYDRYQWIMQEFGLDYVPKHERHIHIGKSKRAMRQKAAREHFLQVRREKLDEIRAKIAEERKEFDKIKEQKIMEIHEELDALGLKLQPSLDETLDMLGVRRMRPKKISVKEVRARKFYKWMKRTGKLKQMQEIREIPPEALPE